MADRRLRLLRQVTRMREIEHRVAASAAAEALAQAQRSKLLARRAEALVQGYEDHAAITGSHELSAQMFSATRMRGVARQAGQQAGLADAAAQAQLATERHARRKLELLGEHRARIEAELRRAGERQGVADPAPGLARFLIDDGENQRN